MDNSQITQALGRASKTLGQCAKAITAKTGQTALSTFDYEMLVGVGIALDWIGWARDLNSISYTNPKRGSFDRAYGTSELTRFTFMWTAANALFSRDTVLKLLDPSRAAKGSELERFRVLFDGSSLPNSDVNAYVRTLHAILSLPMHVQQFPWTAVNLPPTILEVIYYKYTVAHEQTRGLGKKLFHAAASANYLPLDLPTLIYATRNWNIHGVLLSSSFRGTRKKFNIWIDTVNLALARILEGTASAIRTAL